MAHDQVHEQLNALVKGDGGVIGITKNEAALQRWMVGGPDMARILREYEEKHSQNKTYPDHHHEQIPSVQSSFLSDVNAVVSIIGELGNPFTEDSPDLYTLDSKVIMPDTVVNTVKTIDDTGKSKYQRFIEERINDNATDFNHIIPKNSLPLFSNYEKLKSKSKTKLPVYTDVRLFSRMYISCQGRVGDLDNFFRHKNHSWPPSLASNNVINQTKKIRFDAMLRVSDSQS